MTAPKGSVRVKCQGPGCGKAFHSKRANAKYCGDTCRSRARRRGPAESEDELVKAVRADLAAADRLGSYIGQLALKAAHQVVAASPTQAAGLSRELERLMTLALGPSAAPAAADESGQVAEVEDEVEVARRKAREKAARMAAV